MTYDRTAYRGCTVIERAVERLRTPARAGHQYDTHAIVDRAGLVLAALLLWLTDEGDTS